MAELPERFAGRDWANWTAPHVVDVDGVPTAYRRAGTGATVVYLHNESDTRQWTPFLAELATRFDVIAPEHPGFGDTPADARFEGWLDYILHYDAFFRALELGTVHLVGNALGAWLAANLAVTYPDRFSSLVLVTPSGVLAEGDPFIDVFRMSDEEHLDRRFNGRAARYADELDQEGEVEDAVRRYAELSSVALLTWSPRYERRFDTRLARFRAPALIVAAEDDRLTGNGQAARYAELLPDATVVTIPGPDGQPSSHSLTVEQPDAVVDSIAEFVAKIR